MDEEDDIFDTMEYSKRVQFNSGTKERDGRDVRIPRTVKKKRKMKEPPQCVLKQDIPEKYPCSKQKTVFFSLSGYFKYNMLRCAKYLQSLINIAIDVENSIDPLKKISQQAAENFQNDYIIEGLVAKTDFYVDKLKCLVREIWKLKKVQLRLYRIHITVGIIKKEVFEGHRQLKDILKLESVFLEDLKDWWRELTSYIEKNQIYSFDIPPIYVKAKKGNLAQYIEYPTLKQWSDNFSQTLLNLFLQMNKTFSLFDKMNEIATKHKMELKTRKKKLTSII